MKYRRSFHPEDYRLGANVSFYSAMAENGWKLQKRGLYVSRFVKSEPKDVLYRLEIDSREPTEEQLESWRECGWECVTRQGRVNVYRAPAGSAVPERDVEMLSRSAGGLLRSYIIDLVLSVVLLVFFGWILFAAGGNVKSLMAEIVNRLVLMPEMPVFYVFGFPYALLGSDGDYMYRTVFSKYPSRNSAGKLIKG